MWNQKPCFRFEIENFSEKNDAITSQTFRSGGCEWYVKVHPKGNRVVDDHLSLYLRVANHTLLHTGWKRSARFYFVALNQSDKVLYKSPMGLSRSLFCAKTPSFGFSKTMPLRKFKEDTLIIEVYIDIVEADNGEGGEVLETVDINGFRMFAYQATSVKKIFAEHADIAEEFKLKNQVVKTEYMNVLLNLINTLQKPPKSFSDTKLSKVCSDLNELMYAGFKLDWLKSELEEFSLEGKKACNANWSPVQGRVKKLELMQSSFKMDSLKPKLEEVSLAGKKEKADVQKLEKRVSNLELMSSSWRGTSHAMLMTFARNASRIMS